MRFKIEHEIRGRMRIHIHQKKMSCREADILLYYLTGQSCVTSAKVYERTSDAVICYTGERKNLLLLLQHFQYETVQTPEQYLQNTGRAVQSEYWEKLVEKIVCYMGSKVLIPAPVRACLTVCKASRYVRKGLQTLAAGKIEVPVLDGTAIAVSIIRGDFKTASSVMFMLGIGELLEDWTHKKSVDDLARSMSLNSNRVWQKSGDEEILVAGSQIVPGDQIIVRMGNLIPFDGVVVEGEALINQAALTGESVPVQRSAGKYVYAGTVVEEGELVIRVSEAIGSSKFEKIVSMIEETEKLKSAVEGRAEHLADRLVPYTLIGTGLTWLLTRNITKALSVLMVDFSCALKLAMPITVLSAIREANQHKITVKGGKFLEAVAAADTIVFDKTGTLTKAQPTVVDVIPFIDQTPDQLLRLAACLEEHFPHSMAKAVVNAAKQKGLIHEEMHSKVKYIVAHGIATMVNDCKTIIGSYHFVFEDEKCRIPQGMQEQFDHLPAEYSQLYLAVEGELAAVICIEDPLRKEAAQVIRSLKESGISKAVMMTGDSARTAEAVAGKVGVDEYYAEVLPEDKARFVEQEKKAGRTVIMIGDGINDSPALSAADVGIAVQDGAELAREIADIMISAEDLSEIVLLKQLSDALLARIHRNYRSILGINGALILLGVTGVIPPTFSALLHNASTLALSLRSMQNLITEQK